MQFKNSLKFGRYAEVLVLKKIKNKYPGAYIDREYNKFYDINIPEIKTTVEVKSDTTSNDTGNFVVEVEMPVGTPSALSVTKATWWVFFDGRMLFITPGELKNIIKDNNLYPVQFVGDGDTEKKKAYLVKKELIESKSTIFD